MMNIRIIGRNEPTEGIVSRLFNAANKGSFDGNYITPYHVSHLMSECTLNKDEVLGRFDNDPDHVLTLYEPTCGAGGLIVASIDVLNGYGVNYAWNVFVDCGDIDSRCVHMTYLTLSLLGVPAVVRLGDALTMEYREAWFTPAYLIAWPHFKNRIGRWNYPITATVPKDPGSPVIEPKEAPAVAPTESPNIAPKTLEIAPKCDENGQMSLF